MMMFAGTILTSIMMALIVILDLKLINPLESRLPWNENFAKRIFIELIIAFVAGGFVGLIFSFVSELIFGYKQAMNEVLVSNFLIAAVINLIIFAVIEASIYFRRSRANQIKAEILERENVDMRFQMLKKQLDPHFLFNSLNILSSLISKDKRKAQEFIDAFVSMYRYTLEVIEEPAVKVDQEIKFAQDYIFLQKLRFENAITTKLTVDEKVLNQFIPQLALQILLENTFKHNIATKKIPLHIRISGDALLNQLIVSNNMQPKKRLKYNPGVGLENLKNRYKLISQEVPVIICTEKEYIVKLPLIKAD